MAAGNGKRAVGRIAPGAQIAQVEQVAQIEQIGRIPHPIPYQGSKRLLAARILACAPPRFDRLIEPFAGSAAITLAAAADTPAAASRRFVIGDSLAPLARLWQRIVAEPARVADGYRRLWEEQGRDPRAHFLAVRARYNRTGDELLLLFLLARCVKAAVRFNARGEFNQSADHRRRGARPDRMAADIAGAARLLAGRTEVEHGDFAALCVRATRRDLVYLDPPYQGVQGRDPRYAEPLARDRLLAELAELNRRDVPYLLSFDGKCGARTYGSPLPRELDLEQVLLAAGPSSQATLSGRRAQTLESLYLSPALRARRARRRDSLSQTACRAGGETG